MSTRKSELTRQAARLFAEKGYHGTSIGDLADAMGVQKGSLYAHIESKADLLWEVARDGAAAFHAALDTVPDDAAPTDKIRLALQAHLRVVAEQIDVATRAVGRELGVHVDLARDGHRRAGRPLLRVLARRHARLRDAGLSAARV